MPLTTPVGFEGVARPQFGELANRVGSITLDLSVANNKKEIKIGGTFLRAVEATSLNANCEVHLNHYGSDPLPIKKSGGFRGLAFNKILLSNAAQPGETITFVYVTESLLRDFEIFPNAVDFTQVSLDKSTSATGADDDTLAAGTEFVIPANAARRQLIVFRPDFTEAAIGRVGPDAADNNGRPLPPGGYQIFETTAAITVRNPTTSGGDVTFGYEEIGD